MIVLRPSAFGVKRFARISILLMTCGRSPRRRHRVQLWKAGSSCSQKGGRAWQEWKNVANVSMTTVASSCLHAALGYAQSSHRTVGRSERAGCIKQLLLYVTCITARACGRIRPDTIQSTMQSSAAHGMPTMSSSLTSTNNFAE